MAARALIAAFALLLLLPAVAPTAEPTRPLVYVFVVDGLDGDRIDSGEAPFLQGLIDGREGGRATYYRESRAIMVTETNPNHVAIATGAYVNRSGVPGNEYAVYGDIPDEDSCPSGPLDESQAPNATSGESARCVKAESIFAALERQDGRRNVTTAGIFGKPKLGRLFSSQRVDGRTYDADYLWAPCESPADDTAYCKTVPINPATRYAADDRIVMDEVIRTARDGVEADGTTKRPNFTLVNFPQVDSAGHAFGAAAAYDTAIGQADTELQRFVDSQKALGLWSRTVMIVLSDHSMDSTPQMSKTSLGARFDDAGIDSSDYVIVGNGSSALVYLADRTNPGRFDLLKRMRAAAMGAPVTEALYRQPNPADGGSAHTLGTAHPAWRLESGRSGDLVVTHSPGGAFLDTSDASSFPFNPLPGNHGGPQTRDNAFVVASGGGFVRRRQRPGNVAPGFDDTGLNPDQAESVDVASTASCLLGRSAPRQNQGRVLTESFIFRRLPGQGVPLRELPIRLTVQPDRVKVGDSTTFTFTATAPPGPCASRRAVERGSEPVEGALVEFAGRSARTGPDGRVAFSRTLFRDATYTARASKPGYEDDTAGVRAVP